MSMRRLMLGLAPSLYVFALAVFFGGSAQALEVHRFEGSFGGKGSGLEEFDGPFGVAVNDSTELGDAQAGDVYVVDRGDGRVERFSARGVYLGQFNGSGTYEDTEEVPREKHGTPAPTGALSKPEEVAVDEGTPGLDPFAGDVYVVDNGHGVVDRFSPTGAYLGQLTGAGTRGGPFEVAGARNRTIEGVAVDGDGTVWVSLGQAPVVSFREDLEAESSEVKNAFGGASEGIGVDSEDDLYLNIGGSVVEVNSAGETLANPFGGDEHAYGVAVDTVGGEVYLDDLTKVEAFSLTGGSIESDQTGSSFPSFGNFTFSKGVAVNTSTGAVYVTDEAADTVSIFAGIVLPGVSVGALSAQTLRSVTLNGSVNPEGKPVSSCVFEYAGTEEYEASKAFGHSVPCASAGLGSETKAVPVSAKLSGLIPGKSYEYRLVAENVGGKSSSSVKSFIAGPILGGESVTDVTSSSATLQAPVNPNGGDTHYYFQYGPSEGYGSYAPASAPPGVDIGAGLVQQTAGVHLQGLRAGTVYHYRFVVVQGGEAFVEPDRAFTTQSVGVSAVLPDGRDWELVSPPNSNGALIELFERGGQVQAAADGSGIAYMTEGPAVGEGPRGNREETSVLSRRGPAGWGTVNLTLPGTLPENEEPAESTFTAYPEVHRFSPDLEQAIVEPQSYGTPLLAPEATERTLYLRDDLDASYLPLVTPANVPEGTQIEEQNLHGASPSPWQIHFLAATPDLSHVVFKTPKALTPEAIDEETVAEFIQDHGDDSNVQWNLYEWSAGHLQLVNILPDGEVAHGRYLKVPGVRLAGTTNGAGHAYGGVQRAMSSDGRRVAWTWGEPYDPQELKTYRGLYVRDMVEERTVKVGGANAIYQTMNSEGSKVFYLENGDLYVYDWETETSTDLTAGHGLGESSGGVQLLVSDVSEDGSYVYFVADGVLSSKRNSRGEEARTGECEESSPVGATCSLYVEHDGASGWEEPTFIATLSAEDNPDWYAKAYVDAAFLARISSRVSPDGRYLEFMSNRSLTGYDNTDAVSGRPDEEVYLYDAQSGKLVCASCNPTGARPVGVFDVVGSDLLVDRVGAWTSTGSGPEDERYDHGLAGSVPGWDELLPEESTYQPRYLSDSGRLFFDSPVGLVSQDTNRLEDVYEYEPAGIGDCTEATSSAVDLYVVVEGGCVGLISSGTSSTESAFYDASENGDDVFFATTSRLSPLDYDKGYDVYDAHVCTSEVPCTQPPVASPPCNEGESCKAAPTPQPEIFGAPPSATFNGAGNLAPEAAKPAVKKTTKKVAKRCAKSKKLIRGRCVKRAGSRKIKARKADSHRRAAQ